MKHFFRTAIWGLLFSSTTFGASLSFEDALAQARDWMQNNPVMKNVAENPVNSWMRFPDSEGYGVYVVSLAPSGYLVLESDDLLPPIVSFSPNGFVDLSEDPANTFRAMLQIHAEKAEELLQNPNQIPSSPPLSRQAVTEVCGPFLETAWNQCHPFNLLCPEDPNQSDTYGHRTPVGCVPAAYAQLMKFHCWPYHGIGANEYIDSEGSITGQHSAVFSDLYDWGNMLNTYSYASNVNPVVSETAISELMYELGVAVEADYDEDGTSSSVSSMGRKLPNFFYYESSVYSSDTNTFIPAMEADLRAGFPCIPSIPNHSIIADGLMVDSGTTFYHFNLGWGGYNNGWYTADDIVGNALVSAETGLRPRLMPFPVTNAISSVEGEDVELQWIFPKRRENEIESLQIYQLQPQSGNWEADGETIDASGASGWEISSAGFSGNCWYAGPNGPAVMVLDPVFVPDALTELSFWTKLQLGSNLFSVQVSTNNGESFIEIFSDDHRYDSSWNEHIISLSAYAGQTIRLRFEMEKGNSYYTSGGAWVDQLALSSGDWYDWELSGSDTTLLSRRYSATTNNLDECNDFSVFQSTSTTSYKNWVCTNKDARTCFYKQPGGYSNREYHLTSLSTITPTSKTILLLNLKYNLYQDALHIQVSTDGTTFSTLWENTSSSRLDWYNLSISLAEYAGTPIYLRFKYLADTYYTDGSVWIDSVKTLEEDYPELKGQPIYYTQISGLSTGLYTFATELVNTNGVEHGIGPSFTLQVLSNDTDGDGMPDSWETQYGLNPNTDDASENPDSDAYNNFEEYICGTDPTNSASCWKLEPRSGDLPGFYGTSGRLYRIEFRTNLLAGSWEILQEAIIGSESTIEVGDYDAITNATRYYRVQVRLEEQSQKK